MPTRALGALLAAIAAAAFVVSIVSGAWWDGHPRVDGRVFTAKDVHIGLLGGTGCNTGGIGDCQPLPLGQTFTTVAYGELGGLALTTAFAILIMGAAWRIADSRKRLAKLGMVLASLAAAGAVGLLVLGPQIKTTQTVVPPIGWGFFLFGGGIVAMFGASLATLRVEREPLRLKSPPKQTAPVAPTPAPPSPAPAPAPQLRALYEQAPHPAFGAPPSQPPFVAPPIAPPAPPSQPPFVAPPAPPSQPPFVAPPAPPSQPPFVAPPAPPSQPPFVAPPAPPSQRPFPAPPAPRPSSPSQAPFAAPRIGTQSQPPFAAPPPPANLSQPPPSAPIASPGRPEPRTKPPTAAPPPPARSKPNSMPPAPFASPAIASSALAQPRKSAPSIPTVNHSANASASFKAPSVGAPAGAPAGAPSAGPPSAGPPTDPLAATMPAPARVPPPPRVAKISVPPPRRDANPPTPTPSVITSAPRPDGPAPRSSQPTMTHSVPPMPQIDTPPPQLVRGGTENDASLENAMRETDFVTAVEIDHEAKARYEEERRLAEGATVAAPPLRTSEERAAMTDEGLAAHAHGDVPGDDTESTVTATAERMDMDALQDEVASPPATPAPDVPFKSLSAAAAAAKQPPASAKSASEPAKNAEKKSAPKVPISTAPASLPPPKSAAIPASGPTPACPQCEAPMAWVEEHLRFYCKSCRMYF